MPGKNIVISGYYGFGNAGDEAILSSVLDALKSEIPEGKITVLSISPDMTEKEHRVLSVHRYKPLTLLKTLWKSHLLISGGGGLLQDTTSIRSPVYYLGLVLLAKLLGKKVMFYAQGIGPLRTSAGRFLTSYISPLADLITVRDENSLNILKSLGVLKPEIKVTTDPVFAMKPSEEKEVVEIFKKEGIPPEGPWVGISVRNWKTDKDYIEIISQTIDFLCHKFSLKALFIPMHFPEDFDISRKIIDRLKSSAYIIKEKYHPKTVMAISGKMNINVAMRLHGVIMSSAMGVPSIPIAYDPKVERISRQLDLKFIHLDDLTFSKLKALSEEVWIERDRLTPALRNRAADLKLKALENAVIAKTLL